MKYRKLYPALFAVAMLATTGCANSQAAHAPQQQATVIVVKKAPPALRTEVKPRRPSRKHVWVPGHWGWKRGRHVWVKGHWAVPPRHRAVWVPAHWERRAGGWVLVPGRWR